MNQPQTHPDLSEWLDELVAQGRTSFTTSDANIAHGGEDAAVQGVLRRLRAKRRIASPLRGFHLILPPEYRALGCLPPVWFADDLAAHLRSPYYVALLSAAELHGSAHQRPQMFQIMLPCPHRPVRCGGVHLGFTMRNNVAEMPVVTRNTPKGTVRIATAETTAFDLVGYADRVGGLDRVAAVLSELVESLDAGALLAQASLSPLPWSQRLGYLLEHVGAANMANKLEQWVRSRSASIVPLDVAHPDDGGPRDPRWRLIANAHIEVEP